jgi:hypothetical protein
VSESEVKVTLNTTAASEPIRKYFAMVFIEPARKAALKVQGSFEEGSGR